MKNFCFHLNRKLWVTMALLLALSLPALAQKVTIHGTVVDDLGEALIGATVMEKGTSTGTATDIDGNFELNVNPGSTLVVSYVGYDPMDVPVGDKTEFHIVMKENATMLAETVVIGYGSVKKSDATGSVAMVIPDDIEAGIATSTQDLLVGASPGVVVTTNGGDPTGNGTIRIRGGSSLSANNNPLIVVDGVPMSDQSNAGGTNALTMINPQNIESMTILKDASATAIYGSRASNGVIIITTKKGKSGRPQVNFAANWHVNTARKTLNLMNAAELSAVVYDRIGTAAALNMLNVQRDANGEIVLNENGQPIPLADTNWQKEVLRTSFSQDYSISVGGTVGVLPYRVNASFTDNNGILKTSGMQRTTVGFNLSPKFFHDHLSINANASGSYVRSRTADVGGSIGGATAFNPTLPVYSNYPTVYTGTALPAGVHMYNGFTNNLLAGGGPELQSSQNPLQCLLDNNSVGKTYSSNGNLQIDYALHWVPELHFNLNLGYQVSKNTANNTIAPNSIQAWRNSGLNNINAPGAGTLNDWYELQRNTLLDFYINYRKDFQAIRSTLDATVGYSWQRFDYHGRSHTETSSLGFGYTYDNGTYNLFDLASSAPVGTYLAPENSWAGINQLVSFFGRVNYTFDDTWLLTVTLRDDGTSRFSKATRWGLFPSVALGWKIADMNFFESVRDKMNEFKLRLGWGVTGQQDVPGGFFPYMATYTISSNQGFQYVDRDGNWINPVYPDPHDSGIKWEETTTWNVGVDMGWLNNRITANLDWYLRNTKDLIAYTPVAGVNTSNFMSRNIGSLRNIGVEATVSAKPVVTRDVTWTSSLNVAWNRNKITALTGDAETSQIQARDVPTGTGGALQYHLVGEAAYSYMVYQQVYDVNGDPVPGQFVDQNADGVIDDQDKIIYHSPDPKITMTWNNTVNYKNWDFSISLRANFGNYVYNGPLYDRSRIDGVSGYQISNLLRDTFLFNSVDPLSDYFVEDAGFIRCDNISVGYTFPGLFNDNLRLRLFAAVQNPFVITKYRGLDPEVYSGIDSSVYPRPITFTLGVVATF